MKSFRINAGDERAVQVVFDMDGVTLQVIRDERLMGAFLTNSQAMQLACAIIDQTEEPREDGHQADHVDRSGVVPGDHK